MMLSPFEEIYSLRICFRLFLEIKEINVSLAERLSCRERTKFNRERIFHRAERSQKGLLKLKRKAIPGSR